MKGKGRCAVIVGASSGIGEALARRLHREGWRVGLLARRVDRLAAIAAELGPEALVSPIDLSDKNCAEQLLHMFQLLGRADLVI